MEQIRIIKEMRDESIRQLRLRGADVNIRLVKPRYMVWENVPGAFSSNKGEDFRCVLEETAKIADKDTIIPRPEGGRWSPSGCIMGDGWSIAWRVHDAQFWGVPQRRKRIALVADFGGDTAPEILFERQGLSGYSAESFRSWQAAAGSIKDSIGETGLVSMTLKIRSGCEGGGKGALIQKDKSATLGTHNDQTLFQPKAYGICSKRSNSMLSDNPKSGFYEADTSRCLDANGGNPSCNQGGIAVVEEEQKAYGLDRASYNQGANAQYDFRVEEEKIGTQVAKGPGAVCQSIVRRLTPMECERLQGFPDGWTDIGEWVDSKGKLHKDADSPRYKALGNSIALPFWRWMAERMVSYLGEFPTMASLFDGIGGFPLVYSRAGCEPIWASEIEEFPIAVTKIRFPEEGNT